MRVAICDDEISIREELFHKIRKMYPEAEVLLYESGRELLTSGKKADIVLLDIRMPDISGMDIARKLRKADKKLILIFITAFEDYVYEAFDVGAFHYLLKPFDDKKFGAVMESAFRQYAENNGDAEGEGSHIVVHSGGRHIRIRIEDIVFAEIFNRIIVIHKMDEDIRYYGKLSDLEKAAGEDFFRPHRAYLVNFKYVERYDSSIIYMEKGEALIAKKHYTEFVKRYMQYIKKYNKTDFFTLQPKTASSQQGR